MRREVIRLFTIRQEQMEDITEIREVNILAFQREQEAKLVEAIRASEYFIPELSLVAETKKIIGHILS